jgi:hypothetical protein
MSVEPSKPAFRGYAAWIYSKVQPLFPPVEEPQFKRFHGSVQLDKLRMATTAGTIMEEVVKHLTGLLGAKVQV